MTVQPTPDPTADSPSGAARCYYLDKAGRPRSAASGKSLKKTSLGGLVRVLHPADAQASGVPRLTPFVATPATPAPDVPTPPATSAAPQATPQATPATTRATADPWRGDMAPPRLETTAPSVVDDVAPDVAPALAGEDERDVSTPATEATPTPTPTPTGAPVVVDDEPPDPPPDANPDEQARAGDASRTDPPTLTAAQRVQVDTVSTLALELWGGLLCRLAERGTEVTTSLTDAERAVLGPAVRACVEAYVPVSDSPIMGLVVASAFVALPRRKIARGVQEAVDAGHVEPGDASKAAAALLKKTHSATGLDHLTGDNSAAGDGDGDNATGSGARSAA